MTSLYNFIYLCCVYIIFCIVFLIIFFISYNRIVFNIIKSNLQFLLLKYLNYQNSWGELNEFHVLRYLSICWIIILLANDTRSMEIWMKFYSHMGSSTFCRTYVKFTINIGLEFHFRFLTLVFIMPIRIYNSQD